MIEINDAIECDGCIKIKLERRNGDVYWCVIDKEDYEKVKNYRWYCNSSGYAVTANSGHVMRLHSVILDCHLSKLSGYTIDHINRNRLDNRKCNLRICTHSENTQNQKRKSTLFKGIYFNKSNNKWRSLIRMNGITYRLGSYIDPVDAAIAYDIAALTLYGDTACINFLFMVGYSEDEIPDYIMNNVNISLGCGFSATYKSKYKCVYQNGANKWRVRIHIGDKNVHVGSYKTEIDAAKAFNEYVISNNLKRKLNDV